MLVTWILYHTRQFANPLPFALIGCPHAAVREDISANLAALTDLHREFDTQILLIESGGDNLAANYSRELADYIVYVIDVSGGDKIPRKGGPGITQSDLLIVNKTDLAEIVGADLGVMDRDARKIRYVNLASHSMRYVTGRETTDWLTPRAERADQQYLHRSRTVKAWIISSISS